MRKESNPKAWSNPYVCFVLRLDQITQQWDIVLFLEGNLCLHEELQVLQQFQVSCSNLKPNTIKEKAIKIMKGKVTKSVRVPWLNSLLCKAGRLWISIWSSEWLRSYDEVGKRRRRRFRRQRRPLLILRHSDFLLVAQGYQSWKLSLVIVLIVDLLISGRAPHHGRPLKFSQLQLQLLRLDQGGKTGCPCRPW